MGEEPLIEEIDRLQPDLRAVMIELLKEIERQREESITRTIFEEFAKKTEENFNRGPMNLSASPLLSLT